MSLKKAIRIAKRIVEYSNPTFYVGENLRRRYLGAKKVKGLFAKYLGGGSSASFDYGNTASSYHPRSISQLTTR